MKNIILIHGSPEPGEIASRESIVPGWFGWLQGKFPNAIVPEMPLEIEVVYDDWESIFEQAQLTSESVLIGHSCGGGFVLRYLSEHPDFRPEKVILVAPWLDPHKDLSTDFMKFEIDPTIAEKTKLYLFWSSDDMQSVIDSIPLVKEKFPDIASQEFSDREHFFIPEFPELLELLK